MHSQYSGDIAAGKGSSVDELCRRAEELGLFDTVPDNAVKVIEWNKFTDLTGRVIDVKIVSDGENDRTFTVSDGAEAEKHAARAKKETA